MSAPLREVLALLDAGNLDEARAMLVGLIEGEGEGESGAYSRKRYIGVCAGCGNLFGSVRADQLTCDGACRVRAHRSGRLKEFRATAEALDIPPAGIVHAAAIAALRPDLADKIRQRRMTIEECMPALCEEYDKLVWAAVDEVEEGGAQ